MSLLESRRLKKRKRFKYERRSTPLCCFGFSAVSNEYINTPEATSSDNTYTVTIASMLQFSPHPWRYLLFFELVHYSRMRYKHQDIVLLILS